MPFVPLIVSAQFGSNSFKKPAAAHVVLVPPRALVANEERSGGSCALVFFSLRPQRLSHQGSGQLVGAFCKGIQRTALHSPRLARAANAEPSRSFFQRRTAHPPNAPTPHIPNHSRRPDTQKPRCASPSSRPRTTTRPPSRRPTSACRRGSGALVVVSWSVGRSSGTGQARDIGNIPPAFIDRPTTPLDS